MLNEPIWLIEPQRLRSLLAKHGRGDVTAAVPQRPPAQRPQAGGSGGDVAVIPVMGVLSKYGIDDEGWGEVGTSTKALQDQVRRAAADPYISGIVLLLDSPGGTAAGTLELGDAVFEARQAKPVIAFIEDLGASAAYWIASQATQIYANPTAFIGSIGTVAVMYDYSGAAEKMGMKVHVLATGEHKGAGTPGSEILPAHLAHWQHLVEVTNTHFLAAVTRGRKQLAGERLKAVSDGRVFPAAEALQLGLIDTIRSFADVLAGMQTAIAATAARAQARAQAIAPPKPPTIAEQAAEFDGMFELAMEVNGGDRALAVRRVRRARPELHAAWLEHRNPHMHR